MSETKFETNEEKASYGIGLQMGEQFKQMFAGSSLEAALAGFTHAYKGESKQLGDDAINAAFNVIKKQLDAAEASKSADGEAFLAENVKRDEVTVTTSGLQYEVITEGDGEIPTAKSTVRTHYCGTLIDGTEFDSSYKRKQPTEFPVNGVIAGWTEALQLMPVGSKWKLYIPHQLAYGASGAGGAIGPYQALIFDIELLAIV